MRNETETRKTEIGTEVVHVVRDSDTTFEVKMGQGAGAYCGGLPHSLLDSVVEEYIYRLSLRRSRHLSLFFH